MRYRSGARLGLVLAAAVAACVGLSATMASAAGPHRGGDRVGGADAVAAPGSEQNNHNVVLVTTALRVVFTEHRLDQIDTYFAASFVQHSPLVTDPGREGLTRWLSRTLESIPDLTYTSDQVLVDRDRVITFSTV